MKMGTSMNADEAVAHLVVLQDCAANGEQLCIERQQPEQVGAQFCRVAAFLLISAKEGVLHTRCTKCDKMPCLGICGRSCACTRTADRSLRCSAGSSPHRCRTGGLPDRK